MSLKKITLRNFRTCHDVELSDLEHLTVLVGRNGAGKTNILQGIEWLAQTASVAEVVETDALYGGLLPSRISKDFFGQVVFSLDGISYRYTLELFFPKKIGQILADKPIGLQEKFERQDMSGLWRNVLARTDEVVYGADDERLAEIHQAMPMLPAIAALMPSADTKEDILPALAYLRGVKYYSLDETAAISVKRLIDVISRQDYVKWLAQTKNVYDRKDSVLMRLLNMYFDRPDDFDELNELLGDNGFEVLSSIKVRSLSDISQVPSEVDDTTYYHLEFQPGKGWEWGGDVPKLPYDKLSYGTRRIIRLLVSIFYDRNSLFLFEQPEDAIHPGLLRKLIGLLRTYSDKGQVMMASHATDLFDVLQPEEVRLVTMQGGATAVRALTAQELAGAKRFMDKEGSLSEFLNAIEDD